MAISEQARPFALPATPNEAGLRVGVLLSHGFTGSPVSIRPWAEALHSHGYGVRVPRLPGHGTTWQDMNTTGWSDWYGEITRSFDQLRAEHDEVVVGGLSMGGALVLRLAEDRGDELRGVMLVNPAVNSTRLDVKALPVVKHLVGSFPAIANDIKKPGVDEGAYPRTPLKAAHSMMKAWPGIRRDLGKITVPVQFFASTEDHVVDPSSLALIQAGLGTRDFTLHELPNSYHVATLDNDAETIFAESAKFVARVTERGSER